MRSMSIRSTTAVLLSEIIAPKAIGSLMLDPNNIAAPATTTIVRTTCATPPISGRTPPSYRASLKRRRLASIENSSDWASTSEVKLLRVVQEQTFTPVSKNTPVQVDTRFLCATNRIRRDNDGVRA